MDPSELPTGRPSPPRKELQLQGPRPAPLKVRKDSYKIRKPQVAPQPSQPLPPPPPPQPQPPRQPVIIYTVSPKVIHTTASDFMTLVQRLTGPNSSSSYAVTSSSSSSYVDNSGGSTVLVSPAARFATIEKANYNSNSPSEGEKSRKGSSEMVDMVELEGLEINGGGTVERTTGLFPGILSPLPSSLPPISPTFFSPTLPDPNSLGFLQDLSPIFQVNRNYIEGTLVPSPTAFFSSATFPSPTPYMDLFNHLDF
ncbi:protein MKS1-like [Telopea speciosissima]|uniref:protein MKS1-like n=1 Tax=Telopea speciosissima TaxID=54955 RepID=UPI001CC4F985|nr:protein MKS1-like [Telopea speciosissima]